MLLNKGAVVNYKGEFYDVEKYMPIMGLIVIKRWHDGFRNTITKNQLDLYGYVKGGGSL